ncbi:MAG: hypothetical protein FWC41_11875 [Firmicutes bacterium]|nr:hypothetical protein [Bacillota bacterium]
MKNREWLSKKIELNSDKISFILKSYFDENKITSNLTQIEIDKVSCLFISKLLNTPDCVNNNCRVLSYREIFEILITVYDSLRFDDDDLTTECYKLTQFFYSKNN